MTLSAEGTYVGEFDSKNSLEPTGQSGMVSGTYTFNPGNCSWQFMLAGNVFRFRLTDSGRLLYAILYNQADTREQDVTFLQLFRE